MMTQSIKPSIFFSPVRSSPSKASAASTSPWMQPMKPPSCACASASIATASRSPSCCAILMPRAPSACSLPKKKPCSSPHAAPHRSWGPARRIAASRPQSLPAIPWLGVFLPYAPLQHLLFADSRVRALVMTSANLSEEPIAIDNDEALARLGRDRRRLSHARPRDSPALRRFRDGPRRWRAATHPPRPRLRPSLRPPALRLAAAARRRRSSQKRLHSRARPLRLPEPAPGRS